MKCKDFRTHGSKTTCVSGDWNAIDDITGRKVKASTVKLQWDGMRSVEPTQRHPKDFLRGTTEHIKTPWTRVEQEDIFINATFTATNDAGSGSTES